MKRKPVENIFFDNSFWDSAQKQIARMQKEVDNLYRSIQPNMVEITDPKPKPKQDSFADNGFEFLGQVSRCYRHSSNPITQWRSWRAFDAMVKSERLSKIIQ